MPWQKSKRKSNHLLWRLCQQKSPVFNLEHNWRLKKLEAVVDTDKRLTQTDLQSSVSPQIPLISLCYRKLYVRHHWKLENIFLMKQREKNHHNTNNLVMFVWKFQVPRERIHRNRIHVKLCQAGSNRVTRDTLVDEQRYWTTCSAQKN